MDFYNNLMKKGRHHEVLLGGLFLAYSVLDIQTPLFLAELINTKLGSLIVMIIAFSLFLYVNPIISILGIIAAYELIRRSMIKGGSVDSLVQYLPRYDSKCSDLNAFNQFAPTLEQEMVNKMAPLVGPSASPNAVFRPNQDNDHDAAPINYEGVI
jgi:hypothetical protein